MSSKAGTSRSRAPNFSTAEQNLLCRILEAYLHVIECKKTDNIKQAQKQEAWAKVTQIYNANTKSGPRTQENLISCYRNMKSKIKKQHSGAKMVLEDSTQKEKLIIALEENGQDWEAVSECTSFPIETCKNKFLELQREATKKDNDHKRAIMGTGDGPPLNIDDNGLERLKKIIEPQIDGLYTMYDSDAALMKQYQESVLEEDRILPIEHSFIAKVCEDVVMICNENKENVLSMPFSEPEDIDIILEEDFKTCHFLN